MSYFLSIFVLFVSFQALPNSSCKDQKKLLKEACSFRGEKIKSKNLNRANSCKKIKDLFLDLKTKTKENYELCQKAYEKCTENCNRCNKSLVSKFKKKSEKNLKKIKRGFKKASKCVSQLSSDFEKEEKSFTDQSDHKKILEFLKKEDLRKIKEEKRRHKEYLKNEKENRIIRQKLSQTSKKVFERQALSDWARKHKIRTYGKSTKEIKQLKIDYEIKQIKKEGRRERLKLKTQRRESLKKKFEADFLKANPPQTKLEMAIEAVKETFSSYWKKAKDYFGRVFFGEFASAQGEPICSITGKKEDPHSSNSFVLGQLNINLNPSEKFENNMFRIFKEFYTECGSVLDIIVSSTLEVSQDNDDKTKHIRKMKVILLIPEIVISFMTILKKYHSVTQSLCFDFKKDIEDIAKKHKEYGKDLSFLKTTNNNPYHIFAYFYSLTENKKRAPKTIQNFINTFNQLTKITTKEELSVGFLVHFLFYLSIDYYELTYNQKIYYYYTANEYNHLGSEYYKTPINIAIDELFKSIYKSDPIKITGFYERYIASLIQIAGANTRITRITKSKLDQEIQNFTSPIHPHLKNIKACFLD